MYIYDTAGRLGLWAVYGFTALITLAIRAVVGGVRTNKIHQEIFGQQTCQNASKSVLASAQTHISQLMKPIPLMAKLTGAA